MYLIGDASVDEREHARECAACQAKIASLVTPLAHFRGAVRSWSDRASVKDRATELRWTVIPASDHLERLLLPSSLETPWYRSLWSAVRDAFQPAPPLLEDMPDAANAPAHPADQNVPMHIDLSAITVPAQ